jgi:hypothetical protein
MRDVDSEKATNESGDLQSRLVELRNVCDLQDSSSANRQVTNENDDLQGRSEKREVFD